MLAVSITEYPRHLPDPHAPLFQEHQQMVDEVRGLLGEPLVSECRNDDLDRLLADLLGHALRPASEQLRRVRALRHLAVAACDGRGEPGHHRPEVHVSLGLDPLTKSRREEAATLPRVTGRAAWEDPVK